MTYKRMVLADNFLSENKEAIINTWFKQYYVKTDEYQLHSNFTQFGENVKSEITYLFEQTIERKLSEKETTQEHRYFGENRAAISTSLEDLSIMTFSMEANVIHFLSEAVKKEHIAISYLELFEYSVRIRAFFTDAFHSILSGYMNYFVDNIEQTMGLPSR